MTYGDIINNQDTKIFELNEYTIYAYNFPVREIYLLHEDFALIIKKGEEDISRDIAKALGFCYTNKGYIIIATVSLKHTLNRIAGYLYGE